MWGGCASLKLDLCPPSEVGGICCPWGCRKVTALTLWEGLSCFCTVIIRWKLGLGCDMSWNSGLDFFILQDSRLLERCCLSDSGKSRTLSQTYQPHCHSGRGFCFGRRVWGGKNIHGLPILYGITIFLVLHYSNKDSPKSDHLTHLLYFLIRKPAWSWALNLLLIYFPWLMSTEIVTAAEKPADLSESGFVPLIQLLNIWDEAREKNCSISQQINAALHGHSARSQKPG